VTEPYNHDEDDDQPTLQRVAPTSSSIPAALPVLDAFPDEATTATDLDVLGSDNAGVLAVAPIADARDFDDIDTQKMPVEVRADLLRASQVDDGA
jgi:hypothetical protein